ncbi:MAG: methionyl-tRNA formyltransferase [Candidatus Wildermuthbacteria bacterium GWA2_46_15]|uniref:Methionyl-tRNA formyltransferase n=1 Tax=Candidatus Wildermuthbacteria bacterium GWA2_46_15 TaxID=1802443 RepID=A0A1G2QMS9_9BACT|nr:MAG: methionyl-tRNA formyltransferase [Candidatus Wildermuthbacteria bacterium GWA2_46_15]
MNIIFFGTPEFAATILEELIKSNLKPILVVTSPDKPVGRKQVITPPPVKVLAEKYHIPVVQPEDIRNWELEIRNLRPELIIVAAYGPPFLTKEILEIPKYGCLNVHPSLLPKYRGASPIPHAILNGEKETGVTVIRMSEKVDRGDILAQEKTEVSSDETTPTLTAKLASLGAKLLVKTIPLLLQGRVAPQPQSDSPTPYCHQLKKEQGRINWQKSADDLERQIRAFDPWPGTHTLFEGKILKILQVRVTTEMKPQSPPGFVFLTPDRKVAVQTGQGSLVIEMVQLEGKKALLAPEFLRGHKEIIGQILR